MNDVERDYGLLDAEKAANYAGNPWGLTWGQRIVYPGFQFGHGRVRPVITELRQIAHDHAVDDVSLLVFLCSPSNYVEDDGRPVSLIKQPTQLIAVTQRALGVAW